MSESINGRYAFEALDRVLHAPARLGIVTALYAYRSGLSFVELREACELSDGNLSRQLQKLEKESIVKVTKTFVDRLPLTTATLTQRGRKRFERYLHVLEDLVEHGKSTRNEIETRDRNVGEQNNSELSLT